MSCINHIPWWRTSIRKSKRIPAFIFSDCSYSGSLAMDLSCLVHIAPALFFYCALFLWSLPLALFWCAFTLSFVLIVVSCSFAGIFRYLLFLILFLFLSLMFVLCKAMWFVHDICLYFGANVMHESDSLTKPKKKYKY